MKIYNPYTGWKLIQEAKKIKVRYNGEALEYYGITLEELYLKKLPHFLSKIDEINGDFICSHNNLTSLKNCPKIIKGEFDCSHNKLTSLEHCPTMYIYSYFNCSVNNLTSLKYCPKEIKGDFICSHNKLTSLKYCPTVKQGEFDCAFNKLTSLKYCQEIIEGDFTCSGNPLTTLESCPKKVKGYFFGTNIGFSQKEIRKYCKVNVNNIYVS